MGRRDVRVVLIRKPVTIVLLMFVAAAMVALLYFLSGRAYARDSHPAADLLLRILRRDDPSRTAILAALMPVAANALFFMPFGFLTFIALDTPRRTRIRTYAITVVAATLFAGAVGIWQQFLPTRVTTPIDIVANAFGAFAGAIAGHLRKEVHIRFEH